VQPHSVGLFQHDIITQGRMLLHVAVKIWRFALLYEPLIVQNILLSQHQGSMEHMRASCHKSNDGKSNSAAHGTKYDVTQ
jgi:hypothetical protein